jgi:hypothetical protein
VNRDVLTPEEFARRLQISRATVFVWLKNGTLQQGRHFFKYGRVLRFVWNDELLDRLLEDSVSNDEHSEPVREIMPKPKQGKKTSSIDWNY